MLCDPGSSDWSMCFLMSRTVCVGVHFMESIARRVGAWEVISFSLHLEGGAALEQHWLF